MKIYKSLDALPTFDSAVLTIGSYDGVHRGHQSILQEVIDTARSIDGTSILITFHPHPRIALGRSEGLQLLHTQEEKIERCKALGLDVMVIVPFTRQFSNQSPKAYIHDFLIKYFAPHTIVIGYDHRFGKDRKGDIHLLREIAWTKGIKVTEIDPQRIKDIAVSSTKIRSALSSGKVALADSYMGHPYRLSGTVVKGQQIGRTIGFPTANVAPNNPLKVVPAHGIYAVSVICKGSTHQGMLYIGMKPSIQGHNERVIEVHIFDFNQDIYGASLDIVFHKKIREDITFPSLTALKEQLQADEVTARAYFDKEPIVTIAILNYNGRHHLEQYLHSVYHSTSYPHEVCVIDNASTDDSVDYLLKKHPDVRLIRTSKNHGFAGGYNEGMEEIHTKYVVLLNSDVEVTPLWLDPIIEKLDADQGLAAVQPKVLSWKEKDTFEYAGGAGGYLDAIDYPFCRGRLFDHCEKDQKQYDTACDIAWASGAAMVTRTQLYKDVGGLDYDYFAHMEEIDLCQRYLRAGYRLMALPQSVVYHLGGGTLSYNSPRKTYFNFRNSLFTIVKNNDGAAMIAKLIMRTLLDGVSILFFALKGEWKNIPSVLKSHVHLHQSWKILRKKKAAFSAILSQISIGPPNTSGRYRGSIVFDYFVRGIKKSSKLK